MKNTWLRHLKTLTISALVLGAGVIGLPQTAGISTVLTAEAATEYTEGNYTYTAEFGRATITRYLGYEANVRIPETINGLTVSGIDFGAFSYNENIRTVYIPDTIKTMNTQVFFRCSNLTEVRWSSGLNTIPDNTFSECTSLKQITNIGHVTVLEPSAFAKTPSLHTLDASGFVTIQQSAFYKSGLTEIALPSVVEIGWDAFHDSSNLTKVQLGVKTSNVAWGAFEDCHQLSSINFPASLKEIGPTAFKGTAIWTATIPKGVTQTYTSTFQGCRALTTVNWQSSAEIGADMFAECTALSGITISGNPSTIDNEAFLNCSSLKTITIPASVKYIGDSAFEGCVRLTEIKGYYGSQAEAFAKERGIEFIALTPKYKVSFNSKGGTAVKAQSVKSGSKVTAPADPKRKGYLFAGWYQGTKKYNFKTAVKSNLTLTAKWTKVTVAKPAISGLSNASGRKLYVKYKKVSGAYGYIIQYSKKSNFSGAVTVKTRSLTYKSAKLAKGTYYVRIRAYRYDSAKKPVYSSYSKAKKVVIKK